ncbi:MAG: efflux RND transporter permease subunit, partial [Bacillota bacterium]|nr:efflux RND transporter permease subunit [Bacillota bacterium]
MLSKFSVNKPYTVVVAVILVVILGFISFTGMKTDLLPSMNLPYAVVVTSYPGATPEEVETVVTKPVEQAMSTVSNIKTVSSQSSENMSMVILEFYQETNMDSVTLEMRESLDMISAAWTDDTIASPMIMKINPDMMPIMVASVDNEGMDHEELSDFASETVLPFFERIEGVASVTAMGLADESIKVTIDQDRIDDVNDAIAAAIDGDIDKARAALNQARAQLNSASQQIDAQVQAGNAQIAEGEKQLAAAKEQIAAGEAEADKAIADLESQKSDLENQKESLVTQKSAIQGQIKALEDAGEEVPAELVTQSQEIDAAIGEIEVGIGQVEAGLQQAQAGKDEISSQKNTLAQKEQELQAGKTEMADQISSAKAQISQGKAEVESQSAALEKQAESAKEEASIDDVITVDMISGILAAQNFSMPAGSLKSDSSTYTVKVGDSFSSVEELENILLFELDLDGVDDVRLRDVATVDVKDAAEDTYAKVNGNEGILLSFQKQSSYSTSEVSEKINEAIAQIEKENEGLKVTSFMDQGIYIKMITDSVLENLIYGGILAIFILLLFLRDIRPTLIVAISIPASVLFALVMMYFTGVTLNMISLSGLALGVGMLVDNSVVVIENIYRLRREGVERKEAAIEGAKQVSGAIIASTLTTICVFLPIVFTDGMSKELFMDMGLTITFSLVASLLVALSLVPSMANGVLRKEYKGEGPLFQKFQNGYEKILRWVLRYKVVVIGLVTVLLFGSAYFAVAQGTSFIPESDSTEMMATVTIDEDQSQEELWAMADTFMERAMAIDEITAVGGMGESDSTGGLSLSGSSSGGSSISFYLLLDEDKTRTNKAIAKDLEAASKDLDCEVAITASSMDMSMLGGSGIQLQVKGEDLDELAAITDDMSRLLKGVDGVDEVSDSMEDANPELVVTVDKDKAMAKGFTVAQVYSAVSAAIDTNKQASTLKADGKDYPIIVVEGSAETMTADEIADIPLEAQAQTGAEAQSSQSGFSGASAENEDDEDEEEELTV